MSRQFQYESHVQSHVGRESDFMRSPKRRLSHSRKSQIQARMQELISMCRDQNQDINGEFGQVMRAQNDILSMLKERGMATAKPNYAHSDVGKFSFPTRQAPPANHDFIKSKVHELVDDTRGFTPQHRGHTGDEVQQLYQELNHLKNLIPEYEAEIQRLRIQNGSGPGLKELLQQGQRIRQETLALLRNSGGNNSRQVQQLKRKCEALEQENRKLKRMSKQTQVTRAGGYSGY